MFEVGEKIVHGSNGPCTIVDITKLKMPGCDRKRLYYVLRPTRAESSTIYLPVDNEKVVIRRIISKDEAERFMADLPAMERMNFESEKFREDEYKVIMKNGDLIQCAEMMKSLLLKRRERLAEGRKFTTVDEKYLKEVKRLVRDEISLVTGEDASDVEKQLVTKLEG